MLDAHEIVGSHNIMLVTVDSLRYDVANDALAAGRTPRLAEFLPEGWEARHAQGTFTLPAHWAMFAGFFPVPLGTRRPQRLFACQAMDGRTIGEHTYVFDAPDLVTGLGKQGYHTVCIGGVGFFTGDTPLGQVLPSLFTESYWAPEFGVERVDSIEHQTRLVRDVVYRHPVPRLLFVFWNVSATHTPHHPYLPGTARDSPASQGAALAHVDRHLGGLLATMPGGRPWLVIVCADHGDAYGDDGYHGHGIAHPAVWTVPYAEFVLST